MKILHVTDELSKKNYSISSLILFLSNFFQKTQNFKYNILASDIQKDIFQQDEKISIIKFQKFSDIFNNDINIKSAIKKSDIVHIHGLWRAINILVVFYCITLNKNFFVHPHGMLLEPSLKNKGILNYYLKKLSLILINFTYGRNLNFISITNDEIKSILNFFPNSKNIFIPNPVIQSNSNASSEKIKKKFVYFGRLHSIKNIDLMILGFINAKLGKDWYLEIYGLPDDKEYEKKLKIQIQDIANIKICEPIFGDEKIKILNSAWANLLLSKSEVLSLSVLESASLGLPSLVNKNIQIDKFDENEGEVTSLKIDEISKKINQISNWSEETRIQKGSKLKNFIKENYSMNKINEMYMPIYNKLSNFQNNRKNYNIVNYLFLFLFNSTFINTSISYLFNLMVPTFIMLVTTFAYDKSLAADIAITSSILITITQIFASNMKAQVLANNDPNLAIDALLFRVGFSIVFAIFFLVIYFNQNFFVYENFKTIFLIVFLILIQWIYEMVLCLKELRKNNSTFLLYNMLNFIFFILFLLVVLFFDNYLDLILSIYIVSILLLALYGIKNEFIKGNRIDIIRVINLNLKSLAFLSSLSLIASSLIWRLTIFNLFSKEISAILFACFAIGSFPGTAFNLAIGPTYVKKNIILPKIIKIYIYSFYIFLFLVSIFSAYLVFVNLEVKPPNNYFILYTLSFSLLGSLFMTYAMYIRQKSMKFVYELKSNVFFYDVFYGIFITFYCPVLYFIGNVYGTSLSFFLASVTAFLIYTIVLKKREDNVPSIKI